LPKSFQVTFEDTPYRIFLSCESFTCFICKQTTKPRTARMQITLPSCRLPPRPALRRVPPSPLPQPLRALTKAMAPVTAHECSQLKSTPRGSHPPLRRHRLGMGKKSKQPSVHSPRQQALSPLPPRTPLQEVTPNRTSYPSPKWSPKMKEPPLESQQTPRRKNGPKAPPAQTISIGP